MERTAHVLHGVPEGHLGLMLRLKEKRNLKCERHNSNNAQRLQKQPRRLSTQVRKPLFLLENLLQRQHLSSRLWFTRWWRMLICQTFGFVEHATDFQKEVVVNSRFLERRLRAGLENEDIS